MKHDIKLSPSLANSIDMPKKITAEGDSIAKILEDIVSRYQELEEIISLENGDLPRYIRIFINGAPVSKSSFYSNIDTPSQISIVSAVAGG